PADHPAPGRPDSPAWGGGRHGGDQKQEKLRSLKKWGLVHTILVGSVDGAAHVEHAANAAARLAPRAPAARRADKPGATLGVVVPLGLRRGGGGLAHSVRQRRPRPAEQEPDDQHREPDSPAAGRTPARAEGPGLPPP